MKTSAQVTLAVQLCAGAYAVNRGDALAAFLAFTSATSTYLASEEQDKRDAAMAASGFGVQSISQAVMTYLSTLGK